MILIPKKVNFNGSHSNTGVAVLGPALRRPEQFMWTIVLK